MTTRRRRIRAILIAALMLASVMAVIPTASADNPSDVPDSQIFNATDNVSVWERAGFPLRADGRDAVTSVTPPDVVVEEEGTGNELDFVFPRGSLTKNPVGVYGVNDQVDFDFVDGRGSSGALANQDNIQVITARFKNGSDSTVPSTFSEALDLLTKQNANDNATFTDVTAFSFSSLDGSGEASFVGQPPSPGHRVVYVAVHEQGRSGFEINNGQIDSLDGNVAIIGANVFSVQRAPATVNAPASVRRGNSIDFDVDASAAFAPGADVTHTVVLYRQNTMTNSEQRIVLDPDDIDKNFDVDQDTELETTIGETVGVADVEPGITINGESLSDGRVARGLGPAAIVDFVAEDLGTGSPQVTRNSPQSTLYASLTATAGENRVSTVTVDTFSNFSTGTYRWVYVGKLDNNDSAITTATGTISIDSGGTSTGGGGGGDDDEGQTSADGTTVESSGSAQVTVTKTATTTTVNVQNAQQGDTVRVSNDEDEIQTELNARGTALEEVETTFEDQTDFEMSISSSSDKPDPSIPDPPSDKGTVGYINVEHSASDEAIGEVRFNFRVSQDRLDARDIARDEVRLLRYSGGEWTTLETEFVGTADDGTPRFRAVSPEGLSVFAIGSAPAQVTTTEEPTTTAPPETTEAPPETTEPPAATTEPVEEPGAFGGVTPVLVIVVLVILIGAGLWYYRGRL